MIARLSGTLVEKEPGRAVIDVAGVGYEVTIPLSTYYLLSEPGSRVELLVHTHVREEALALYGFGTRLEKDLFVRLIGIGGIGPKTAVAILSGLQPEELIAAVRHRDAGRLAAVPGIGRKTADRVLLEMADRVEEIAPPESPGDGRGSPSLRQDLVSALVNLGYNARVASEAAGRALKGRQRSAVAPSFESLLRETLRSLSH